MRKLLCLLLALLLILPLLCACRETAEEGDSFVLWFVSEGEGGALSMDSRPYSGARDVPSIMDTYLLGTAEHHPSVLRLRDWEQRGGVLWLDIEGPYDELTGLELTLANYCITLTLTQLPGVKSVSISVNGTPFVQGLRREDVVLSGAEEQPVELTAALYFRRPGGNELGMELRVFRLTESESATLAVLEALLAGPQEAGLTAVLPTGVAVNSARVEGGVCYADLSAALLEQIPGSPAAQTLAVRSIVESLCSLGHVQAVQLLVDGEPLERYGLVDVSQPLDPETLTGGE